ncbi:MAG: hypothetical protein OXG90_00395, partial [Gammaproteobacteria bacterium]|nr:hypothetical protein [Gammaproteobacteria bacterium]
RDQPKDTQNAGNLPGVSAIYSIKSDSWDFTDKNQLVIRQNPKMTLNRRGIAQMSGRQSTI